VSFYHELTTYSSVDETCASIVKQSVVDIVV